MKKLTQDDIIQKLIKASAYDLAYKTHFAEYAGSINLPVLRTMAAKNKIVKMSGSLGLTWTAAGLKKYGDTIRERARALVLDDMQGDIRELYRQKEQYHAESYLRYCTKATKRQYWSNGPEFFFCDFYYVDHFAGCERKVCFHYDHAMAVNNETQVRDFEIALTRCDIARIPESEVVAL